MKNEFTTSGPAEKVWMIVDDDEGMREFMHALLESVGRCEVQSFSSAPEALAAFTATPDAYQFVLTDFEMPGMNGAEFCRRLHSLKPGLQVLLVSGQATITDAQAEVWGFCGLIKKPFPAAELQEILEAIH
ncbi:MAG: response regulator [Verrucomicrobiota bacterium]